MTVFAHKECFVTIQGKTVLMISIENGDADRVNQLLKKGATVVYPQSVFQHPNFSTLNHVLSVSWLLLAFH